MSFTNGSAQAKGFVVAIIGATGAVGKEFIHLLAERNFPVDELRLVASEKSAGTVLEFMGEEIAVKKLENHVFDGVDLAFFSAGSKISLSHAAIALSKGCVVVDNSSAFRMNPEIPLVIPEINGDLIRNPSKNMLVANPNCSTAQLVLALHPLHKKYTIKRVVVSTYQATSGAGAQAMEELRLQIAALFNHKEIMVEKFPHQIAFNLIPQIGNFDMQGFSEEERKIERETQKILCDASIKLAVTTVRVPTFHGHAESVAVEFEKPFESVEHIQELLDATPGVSVIDEPTKHQYPMLTDVQGQDDVFVGRIRRDTSVESGALMWICADNLRKGAALNAIQIAETIFGLEQHS